MSVQGQTAFIVIFRISKINLDISRPNTEITTITKKVGGDVLKLKLFPKGEECAIYIQELEGGKKFLPETSFRRSWVEGGGGGRALQEEEKAYNIHRVSQVHIVIHLLKPVNQRY